jgi:hypothetical protein
MDEKQHAPPVPPDELIEPSKDQLTQFLVELTRCHSIANKRMFVRQWVRDWTRHKLTAQAIPEREELAQLLMELAADNDMLFDAAHQAGARLNQPPLSRLPINTTARARAAAERLRGGGSDG